MMPVKRGPIQCLMCGCFNTVHKMFRWPWRRKDRWRCGLCGTTFEQV